MTSTTIALHDAHALWLPAEIYDHFHSTRPFYTFILKIASRCNIDCDYCFMYQHADQSWRRRPKFMNDAILRMTANRIADHVVRHQLAEIDITFHGGEPLLAGARRLAQYASVLYQTIPCRIKFGLQTNGILITNDLLDVIVKYEIATGISLDGNQSANDRHRRYRNGRSSFDDVLAGLALFKSRPDARKYLGGFLAVIDLRNTPSDILRAMSSLGATSMDLLLPDCNHDNPPPAFGTNDEAPYGKWLAEFFDIWWKNYDHIEVRFLEEIMALVLGGKSSLEAIGAQSVDLIVIETDGDIEAVDTLKIVGEKATGLGMNVTRNALDDALDHPAIYSRMLGDRALCQTCRKCSELRCCSGGYLPHRFHKKTGFVNPSVYCKDLLYIIQHIRTTVNDALMDEKP